MNMPTIQIRTTPALLGIEQERAQLNLRQPRASMEIETEAPRINMRQPSGELHVDQAKAWDALAIGNHLEMMKTIYSVARTIALQNIGRIAQEGDRMMAIHNKANPFAEIAAGKRSLNYAEFSFAGPASYDNVDLSFTPRRPELELIRGTVNVNVTPNLPQMDFQRGNINIYMVQYNSIRIIPPEIDVRV